MGRGQDRQGDHRSKDISDPRDRPNRYLQTSHSYLSPREPKESTEPTPVRTGVEPKGKKLFLLYEDRTGRFPIQPPDRRSTLHADLLFHGPPGVERPRTRVQASVTTKVNSFFLVVETCRRPRVLAGPLSHPGRTASNGRPHSQRRRKDKEGPSFVASVLVDWLFWVSGGLVSTYGREMGGVGPVHPIGVTTDPPTPQAGPRVDTHGTTEVGEPVTEPSILQLSTFLPTQNTTVSTQRSSERT